MADKIKFYLSSSAIGRKYYGKIDSSLPVLAFHLLHSSLFFVEEGNDVFRI
jgi:hypothetical protein